MNKSQQKQANTINLQLNYNTTQGKQKLSQNMLKKAIDFQKTAKNSRNKRSLLS